MSTAQQSDYSHLVQHGHYNQMPSGLSGKFDNVRRYWENQITRFAIEPHVCNLLQLARGQNRKLRVADLGCGSGEGWDLLMQIPVRASGAGRRPHLLQSADVGAYHGVDLCPDMIAAAARNFSGNAAARFDVCDLAEPDDFLEANPGFDFYFSSYGSLSHLEDRQLSTLLTKISSHARPRAVIVLDLLGQYSIEWPRYWGYSQKAKFKCLQPYSMTWLYPRGEQQAHRDEFANYRIRYWGGREIMRFLESTPGLCQRIRGIVNTDRSILIGRHVDTSEFNPEARPLRQAVNSLFEFNHHPNPADLRVGEVPRCRDAEVKEFYGRYGAVWNSFVDVYGRLAAGMDAQAELAAIFQRYDLPPHLTSGLKCVVAQAGKLGWLQPGDPLANALQPQFGLLLRNLEFHLQRGLGCGHGLLTIIELD